MKLPHQSSDTPTTSLYSLPRPDGSSWTFQLSPLPLGFQRRLHERGLSPPLPPLQIVRDSQGKPVRDASGLALTQANDRDPGYRSESEQHHQRVAVLALVEALRHDRFISFNTLPPPADTRDRVLWISYADAIYQELAEVGFSDGDLIHLCGEICRISNLLDQHLSVARSNFSLAEATSTA
jgi:hypothetical protein